MSPRHAYFLNKSLGFESLSFDNDILDIFYTTLLLQQMLRANKKGHVESCVINPKCCKLGELYGESDPNTFEWSDGLIASTVRRFAKELSSDAKSEAKAAQSTTRGGGGGATATSSRNRSEVKSALE